MLIHSFSVHAPAALLTGNLISWTLVDTRSGPALALLRRRRLHLSRDPVTTSPGVSTRVRTPSVLRNHDNGSVVPPVGGRRRQEEPGLAQHQLTANSRHGNRRQQRHPGVTARGSEEGIPLSKTPGKTPR